VEEILDVYDKNGNLLGQKTRSFCHSENAGVFHKAVWILVKNKKGEILIQKRSMNKKEDPGKWCDTPVAGHISAGDSPIETCVRETKEELDIDTKPSDFIFLREFLNEAEWELGQIYLLNKEIKLEDIKIQKEEMDEVKYVSYDEFIKLLHSDEFSNEPKEYKDFIAEVLK